MGEFHKTMKVEIVDELNKRIDQAQTEDEIEVEYALNSFREWFFERYIY